MSNLKSKLNSLVAHYSVDECAIYFLDYDNLKITDNDVFGAIELKLKNELTLENLDIGKDQLYYFFNEVCTDYPNSTFNIKIQEILKKMEDYTKEQYIEAYVLAFFYFRIRAVINNISERLLR